MRPGRSTGCSLFRYVECSDALELHRALAQQGILVRLFDRPAALRFGCPPMNANGRGSRLACTHSPATGSVFPQNEHCLRFAATIGLLLLASHTIAARSA